MKIKPYNWNIEKNNLLKETRKISFEENSINNFAKSNLGGLRPSE